MKEFQDKVAVIMGGASGIGLALAIPIFPRTDLAFDRMEIEF